MVAMYNPLDQETVAQPKLAAPISSYANPAAPAAPAAPAPVAPPAPAVPKAPVEQKPVPTVLPPTTSQPEIGYTRPAVATKADFDLVPTKTPAPAGGLIGGVIAKTAYQPSQSVDSAGSAIDPRAQWAGTATGGKTAVVPQQLKTDFANAITGMKTGQIMDWAGGKLQKLADGRAVYVGPSGTQYLDPRSASGSGDSPFEALAANPEIRKQWQEQYGYVPTSGGDGMAAPTNVSQNGVGEIPVYSDSTESNQAAFADPANKEMVDYARSLQSNRPAQPSASAQPQAVTPPAAQPTSAATPISGSAVQPTPTTPQPLQVTPSPAIPPTAPPSSATPSAQAPGLIQSRIIDPTLASSVNWDVNGDQLVEDRTNKIIGKDSELMQRAKAQADQQSNARGLINSSMAVGAGQAAVLDRAVDIAKSDASTFAQSAQFNADSKNKLSMFNAGADNQFKLADKSIDAQAVRDANQQTFDLAKMDKQAATTLSQMSAQQQNDLAKLATQQGYNIQNMSAQNVNDLAKLDKQIKAQADQQAAQLASNRDMFAMQTAASQAMQELQMKNSALLSASGNATSILNGTQGRIASIMQDQNLDGPAKQAAIDRLNENAQVSINLIGKLSGDLNLSDALSGLLG